MWNDNGLLFLLYCGCHACSDECVLFESGMLLTVVPGVHDGLFIVSNCREVRAVSYLRVELLSLRVETFNVILSCYFFSVERGVLRNGCCDILLLCG